MHDDRLRVRRVLAGADAGEIDDFSGITADGIDLGVQQVDLSLQLFLFLFHLLHFAVQFRHELIFLLPKLLLEGLNLRCQFCKFAGLCAFDILHLTFQLLNFGLVSAKLFLDRFLRQRGSRTHRNDAHIADGRRAKLRHRLCRRQVGVVPVRRIGHVLLRLHDNDALLRIADV